MKLSDAVSIVTGGAGGFGRAFATKILADGGRVVLTDLKQDAVDKVGKELAAQFGADRIVWTPQDIADRHGFQPVFALGLEKFGKPINLLVNNAGVNSMRDYIKPGCSTAWENVIEIDLVATARGVQVAMDLMHQQLNGQEGVIVNIASAGGLLTMDQCPEFTAAKAGVIGLTRALWWQKDKINVRVVAVCPMYADTPQGQLAAKYLAEEVNAAGGLIGLEPVVDGLVLAVEDEKNAGRSIYVGHEGVIYWDFPEPPQQRKQ